VLSQRSFVNTPTHPHHPMLTCQAFIAFVRGLVDAATDGVLSPDQHVAAYVARLKVRVSTTHPPPRARDITYECH
jgi:hypothetical protein